MIMLLGNYTKQPIFISLSSPKIIHPFTNTHGMVVVYCAGRYRRSRRRLASGATSGHVLCEGEKHTTHLYTKIYIYTIFIRGWWNDIGVGG